MKTPRQIERDAAYYLLGADQGRVFRKITEFVAALAALTCGAQFIVFGYSSGMDIYQPMRIVASADMWGLLMVILGVTRIVVLAVNGWWPHSILARKWLSCAFLFGVWLPLGACFWWNFVVCIAEHNYKTFPGLSYSVFTAGMELMIFYAHSTYVYAAKERANSG